MVKSTLGAAYRRTMGVIHDQGHFYHVDHLRVIGMKTARMNILERAFFWVYLKVKMRAQDKVLVGKCWVQQ